MPNKQKGELQADEDCSRLLILAVSLIRVFFLSICVRIWCSNILFVHRRVIRIVSCSFGCGDERGRLDFSLDLSKSSHF